MIKLLLSKVYVNFWNVKGLPVTAPHLYTYIFGQFVLNNL
jgi:hypothetical protein